MANYKVPQDVEAEDKLLGPLTLKQFLFAMAFFGLLYITYLIFLSNPFMSLITLPMLIVTGAFAFWQRKDQPVEVFFRAGILFFTKPHIRKWDQDGALKLVEILVPKKIKKRYTDGRSAQEVKSQLNQISQVLDTRGWNNRIAVNEEEVYTERLVPLSETPITAHVSDFAIYDKAEDQQAEDSSIAQNIQEQIDQSGMDRQQQIHQIMDQQLNNLNQNVPNQTIQQISSEQVPQNQNYTHANLTPQIKPIPEPTLQPQQVQQPIPNPFLDQNNTTQQPSPVQTTPLEFDKITQAQSQQPIASSDEFMEGEELDLH